MTPLQLSTKEYAHILQWVCHTFGKVQTKASSNEIGTAGGCLFHNVAKKDEEFSTRKLKRPPEDKKLPWEKISLREEGAFERKRRIQRKKKKNRRKEHFDIKSI